MSRYKYILNNIQNHLSANESETPEMELMEYKEDFLNMNIGSLKMIMESASAILSSLDDESVRKNLTASWLQGKIAITEDYMRTIHDFVKYVPDSDDKSIAGCGCGKKKNKEANTQSKPKTNTDKPNTPEAKPKE